MENQDLNLRMMDSVLHKLLICVMKAEEEKAKQCLHSHKDCSDFLHYFITRNTSDNGSEPNYLRIAPDYSLLAATDHHDGPNDFDTGENALKLGALELAFSVIKCLSEDIDWKDLCGEKWSDTFVTRMLIFFQFS